MAIVLALGFYDLIRIYIYPRSGCPVYPYSVVSFGRCTYTFSSHVLVYRFIESLLLLS